MVDEQQRKRRVLIAIVAVVALIGVGGVTTALLVGDDGDGDTVVSMPGASIDPFTAEGICRSDGVVTFTVTPDPDADPELTATGAVEPWVGKGETSQTTSTGESTKLVSIGNAGELPRSVLTVNQGPQGWTVVETAGCLLDASDRLDACPADTLEVGKATYAVDEDAAEPQLAKLLGTGTLRTCEKVDGRRLVSRGDVAPVTVHAVRGKDSDDVVAVVGGPQTRTFERSR